MKFQLHLSPVNGGPFNCLPARMVELEADKIATNDIHIEPLDGKYIVSPSVRLWVVGNEFGAVGAVWARHEQEALDELIDQNFGDCFLISEKDQKEASDDERQEWTHLGNAGEPCNLDHAWIQEVTFEGPRDWLLIAKLAEARGNGLKNLDF